MILKGLNKSQIINDLNLNPKLKTISIAMHNSYEDLPKEKYTSS